MLILDEKKVDRNDYQKYSIYRIKFSICVENETIFINNIRCNF